ncbi:hypothetical protein FF38_11352 [Lucilia cuprina]|uniref:Uncharacterized protein n=1 Tax=Lucilia cuprina TaxID=7375 RepID=A0A0L0CRR2_LUCCU|nr:hypothetical protein FF38_11352 [Lucilia cuprina]
MSLDAVAETTESSHDCFFLVGVCIRLEPILPGIPQRGYYGKGLDSSSTSTKCLYMTGTSTYKNCHMSSLLKDSGAMVDRCQVYPVDEKDHREIRCSR